MAIDFEIIVGTHEEFLLGYKVHNIGNVSANDIHKYL